MKLKVAELFAGVGGFRVGLNNIKEIDENGRAVENGDWEFVWANQFEPSTKIQHAFDCYVTRFGQENNSNVDIEKVDKTEIPDHSLLVGGFPCQDYSVARILANEKGIEGKKGVLFWSIRDVLVEKSTPFVLLENVDRLTKSPAANRGRDFAIILKTLDELGYNAQWRVINAGEYGMPQKRRRVFIFAYKKDTDFSKSISKDKLNLEEDNIFNKEFKMQIVDKVLELDLNEYKDILSISDGYRSGKLLDTGIMIDGYIVHAKIKAISEDKFTLGEIVKMADKGLSLEGYIIKDADLEGWKKQKSAKKEARVAENGHQYSYSEGSMAFPDKMDEPARTILTSESKKNRSSHVVYDEKLGKYRTLTPNECELIQMFPLDWTNTMTENKRYFMMGNALVTGIISRIEPKLKEIIGKE